MFLATSAYLFEPRGIIVGSFPVQITGLVKGIRALKSEFSGRLLADFSTKKPLAGFMSCLVGNTGFEPATPTLSR